MYGLYISVSFHFFVLINDKIYNVLTIIITSASDAGIFSILVVVGGNRSRGVCYFMDIKYVTDLLFFYGNIL